MFRGGGGIEHILFGCSTYIARGDYRWWGWLNKIYRGLERAEAAS